MDYLRKLEESLHQYETRSDPEALKKLLHPDFKEIGYSGRYFDFDSIVNDVLNEEKPNYSIWSQDFDYVELAANLVQLNYKEARIDVDGNLSRCALRTSIWQKTGSHWQVRFHQGTPTETFIKSKT
ncbi:MAG: DUF4440 domain-containing protein [Aestuariibacter sp.]